MAFKSVLFFVGLLATVLAQSQIRLGNGTIPLHYDVELTIDVSAKRFSVLTSISISVLEETTEITVNTNSLVPTTSWLASSRLISENGQVIQITSEIEENDRLRMGFLNVIPDGNYVLEFEVEGFFGEGLVEVPLSLDDTSELYLLSTGFNTTNLRAVFPCFDQPEFRTTFNFTVYHEDGYILVTNTEEVFRDGPIIEMNNFIRNTFNITEPLPTSSIGIALTNMPVQSSTDNRVQVYHNNPTMGKILLNNFHSLLLAVEEELNFSQELPKLDIIYAPTLSSKTLTKWGLVLVGPEMSPVENSVVHSIELKDIQKEIARSVYQQFFCHLFNPDWWSDSWITLGLARYFSGVTKHLQFDAEAEFISDTVRMVIREHSVWTMNAMAWGPQSIQEINNPNMFAIDQRGKVPVIFLLITNDILFIPTTKAGALMRMIANIMGREIFNAAILDLLKNNKYSSISANKFLNQLDRYTGNVVLPEGRSLSDVIHRYANASPHNNLMYLFMDQWTSKLTLRSVGIENVDFPIDYMTPSTGALSQPRFWIPRSTYGDVPINVAVEPWMILNPQEYGLFRMMYSKEIYAAITLQLTKTPEVFNRPQLISETASFMWDRWLIEYLNLIRYLPTETDMFAWREARISYDRVAMLMRGYNASEPFYGYFNSLAEDVYSRNAIGVEMNDFEMTMEVARITCAAGHMECVKDAEAYYAKAVDTEAGLVGSSDFQVLVYCTLARHSTNVPRLEDDVLRLWVNDRRVHSKSRNAIKGLACTSDGEVVKRFLDIAVTDQLEVDMGIVLAPSERFFLLNTLFRGSHEAVMETLAYILEHYEAIQLQRVSMAELFNDIHYYIRTQEAHDLLKAILDTHVEEFSREWSVIGNQHAQAFSTVANNIFAQALFEQWLDMPGHASIVQGFHLLVMIGLVILKQIFIN